MRMRCQIEYTPEHLRPQPQLRFRIVYAENYRLPGQLFV
jgi:hypothetical protein